MAFCYIKDMTRVYISFVVELCDTQMKSQQEWLNDLTYHLEKDYSTSHKWQKEDRVARILSAILHTNLYTLQEPPIYFWYK